jgi:hypothetical protein
MAHQGMQHASHFLLILLNLDYVIDKIDQSDVLWDTYTIHVSLDFIIIEGERNCNFLPETQL